MPSGAFCAPLTLGPEALDKAPAIVTAGTPSVVVGETASVSLLGTVVHP